MQISIDVVRKKFLFQIFQGISHVEVWSRSSNSSEWYISNRFSLRKIHGYYSQMRLDLSTNNQNVYHLDYSRKAFL